MKLIKKEQYFKDGNINYRYFRDTDYTMHGYEEWHIDSGEQIKQYKFNDMIVGLIIWRNKKLYNI